MSLGSAFCVVCGDEAELTKERMCESCLRDRTTLSKLPDRLQGFRCPKCSMIDHAGRWSELPADDHYEGLVMEALEIDERAEAIGIALLSEEVDERNTRLSVQVTGFIEDYEFEDVHSTLARISNSVCPTCTRKAGNYFEATVQLRSTGRRLSEDELNNLRATLDEWLNSVEPDPMFFINSEGPVAGGYDVILGSKAMARGWTKFLVKRFGGNYKETNTVVGRRDGEDLTRLTISYRKPAFEIGDMIRLKSKFWLIWAWQRDGALLSAVERLERTGVTWRDLEKASIISRVGEQIEVEVLRRDSTAADFMDPNDWKIRTVALPYDDDPSKSTIRIALIGEEWLALPNPSTGE